VVLAETTTPNSEVFSIRHGRAARVTAARTPSRPRFDDARIPRTSDAVVKIR